MPVEFKDYYKVLGVARDASEAEIKKAFRNLARKHHPDVAQDSARSDDRFKEINEANEVLSDPESRRKYDELGANWNHPERQTAQQRRSYRGFGGAPAAGAEFHFEGTGFSDFFEQFFGSRGRPPGNFGQGGPYDRGQHSPAQRGQDVEGGIMVTLDEVLHGSTREIRLQRVDPRTGESSQQTLRVKIPPGVRVDQLIRIAGKGQEGISGGASGNLYLRVAFAKHPEFRVRGVDLYYDLELAPWEAVLGAAVRIPTLEGTASLTIPPGTTAARQFRMRGMGLPTGTGMRGDLYALVSLQVPSDPTPDQKILWEQLAQTSAFNPRKSS